MFPTKFAAFNTLNKALECIIDFVFKYWGGTFVSVVVVVGFSIIIPVSFIQDLTQAASLQDVLNVMANWIFYLFSAERASITIKENDTSLKLYSVMGSNAIPMESLVPIKGTIW